MKVRAQIGMVLNLDKCIGCHTCSVTCKNVWTNRPRLSCMASVKTLTAIKLIAMYEAYTGAVSLNDQYLKSNAFLEAPNGEPL